MSIVNLLCEETNTLKTWIYACILVALAVWGIAYAIGIVLGLLKNGTKTNFNAKDKKSGDIYRALRVHGDPPPDFSMKSPFNRLQADYEDKEEYDTEEKEPVKKTPVKTAKKKTDDEDWLDEMMFFDTMNDD